MKGNAVVLTQFFPPDITAAAFRLGEHVSRMAETFDRVTVVTAEAHKSIALEGESQGAVPRVRILRSKVRPRQPKGGVQYIAHYLSFALGATLVAIRLATLERDRRVMLVYASSPPLFVAIPAVIAKWLFRAPLVFEVRDIWPDSAVAAGQIPGSGLIYRLGKFLELWAYRRANHLVCVASPMQQRIASQTSTPVTVVYNGIEVPRRSQSGDGVSVVPKTLLYCGNLGLLQELDLLVDAFVDLHRNGEASGWTLELLGGGAQVEPLRAQVSRLEAEAVVNISPPVPKEQALRAMQEAELLYLNLKSSPVLELTIPSKVFDYLYAARPIVAGLKGEGAAILEETAANITFAPGDREALKAALRRAIASIASLSQRAPRNRELVLERFTRDYACKVLMEVFETATASRRRV